MKDTQLMLAARTVTRRTPPTRVKFIRARLSKLRQNVEVAAMIYHLATGTVPRSLWNND
jgi:hypothetical protein